MSDWGDYMDPDLRKVDKGVDGSNYVGVYMGSTLIDSETCRLANNMRTSGVPYPRGGKVREIRVMFPRPPRSHRK